MVQSLDPCLPDIWLGFLELKWGSIRPKGQSSVTGPRVCSPLKFWNCRLTKMRFHSQLQKRERTETSFLYRLDWKSKHFKWDVSEWKATLPSLRVFRRKLFKWEPRKVCKIPYKSIWFCGLSTQSIQTLYFRWYLKSYHFAVFRL